MQQSYFLNDSEWVKFIVPNWCPNFYWLNFPDPRFPRNVKTYQHWAVVCYWLLCCLLTALNSKHSCLLMFSHFLVCLNNLTLICTIQVSSLFVLCNCCCFVPLHVPAMHLDLLLDTIQAELNSITKVTHPNTWIKLVWFCHFGLAQPGLSLLLSWKTVQLLVVENKIAASQPIGLSCHEFTRPSSNSKSFHLLAD